MTWRFLYDQTHQWKGHVAPSDLCLNIEAELYDRRYKDWDDPIFVTKDLEENKVILDEPGWCWTGRKYFDVVLDGLTVSIPCLDWSSVLFQLRLEKLRSFNTGEAYYKYHSWNYCLVLTPSQRDFLLQTLEARRKEADKQADLDLQVMKQKFDEVNKEAGRTVVVSQRVEASRKAGSN